ncbi:MAG: alpha/beta hydrolase fold domain-containing protein [Homoserinimonas sp.]
MSFALNAIIALLPLTGRKRRLSSEKAVLTRVTGRVEPTAAHIPKSLSSIADISEQTVLGRRVITVTPRSAEPQRDVVYLHGGSYLNPLVRSHWAIVRELVMRADARVTVPLYGLAPEHTANDAYPFLTRVYEGLRTQSTGAEIVLAGDSAGGGLALAFCQQLRDSGTPMPAGLLMIAPWLDVTLANPEAAVIEGRDPMLAIAGLRAAGRLWAGGRALEHPTVSPLFGRLRGLPPMLVVQGGRDLTAADVRILQDRVAAGGGEIEVIFSAAAFHVFVGLPFLPEARAGWQRVEAWLRGHIG